MRKTLSIFLIISLISNFQVFNIRTAIARPGVSAQAAVLIEQQSGRVLFGTQHRERLGMASTTKIMTAIVALEHGDITDMVEVSAHAAAVEGSSMWLEAGENIPLEDLIWGLMLASGNDAAAWLNYRIHQESPYFLTFYTNYKKLKYKILIYSF
ncbi:MAG: hypothetical protein FWE04_03325 [Oscillospiraceae bacterium]|nr:hypothetical protein [Oscillospiraceae bacterium]